jgi:hypothetical protein
MSVAAQLVRGDVKHEVAKANRLPMSGASHLVALRCHNSSAGRHLAKQIIDRRSPAAIHGQVWREQAGLRRLQCNPRGNT